MPCGFASKSPCCGSEHDCCLGGSCDSCAFEVSEKARAQVDSLIAASLIKSRCALRLRFYNPCCGSGHDCCLRISCCSCALGVCEKSGFWRDQIALCPAASLLSAAASVVDATAAWDAPVMRVPMASLRNRRLSLIVWKRLFA